jgi:DNA-binding transcriptional MerR regulator
LRRAEAGQVQAGAMPEHDEGARKPAEAAYFRIGEVSRLTGTKAFVLRYWETEFPMLAPYKSPSGHRLYRRQDIETVFEIKRLLYDNGFTIAGARKYLAEKSGDEVAVEAPVGAARNPEAQQRALRKLLLDAHTELKAILTLLKSR